MGNFFNSISKMVKEGYQNISDKAEEVTKIGRLKIEIIAKKRDIEKLFVELGGRFYNNFATKKVDLYKDKTIIHLIKQIKDNETEMQLLKEKIDKIKKENGIEV